MKQIIVLLLLTIVSTFTIAQENSVSLSGGYSFAKIEDSDIQTTGWRINLTYQFNPTGTKFAHGVPLDMLA